MANKPLEIHAQVNFVTVSSEEDIAAYRAGISLLLKWMQEEKQKEITKARHQVVDFDLTNKPFDSADASPLLEEDIENQRAADIKQVNVSINQNDAYVCDVVERI